ncbi:hypothetical protein GobsT_66910 [Gemmata obscuriglobus]|uniref:Uncharacterized protein n=2 Tax=Gemmata obscuriglobus TaxID=114 RepID=A0A2Z3GQR4_9BACT|nr:hypothetical protein C1280_00370 [Gemmata obscuriglobus]QEG31844.1 hypothetical protein GobsT_66910 [Gemmata obscuriglobus]VTS11190.1 unnamed protein product [Gemmata obscuriglobus UQM 2246]
MWLVVRCTATALVLTSPGWIGADDATLTRLKVEGRPAWRALEESATSRSWTGRVTDEVQKPGEAKVPGRYHNIEVAVRRRPDRLAFEAHRKELPDKQSAAHSAIVFNPTYSFIATKPQLTTKNWSLSNLAVSEAEAVRMRDGVELEHGWLIAPHRFYAGVRMDEWFDQPFVKLLHADTVREDDRELVRATFDFTLPADPNRTALQGEAVYDPGRGWAMLRRVISRPKASDEAKIQYAASEPSPLAWERVTVTSKLPSRELIKTFTIESISQDPTPDESYTLPAYGLPEIGAPRDDQAGGQTPPTPPPSWRWGWIGLAAFSVVGLCLAATAVYRKRRTA